jgi:hypothetical protein
MRPLTWRMVWNQRRLGMIPNPSREYESRELCLLVEEFDRLHQRLDEIDKRIKEMATATPEDVCLRDLLGPPPESTETAREMADTMAQERIEARDAMERGDLPTPTITGRIGKPYEPRYHNIPIRAGDQGDGEEGRDAGETPGER